MSQKIATQNAPAAIGPYSQGMISGNFVFTSGQLPVNPQTKGLPGDVREQARQSLENVKAVLEAAGSGLDRVLKTTVYLTDIGDFAAVNEIYGTYFAEPFPARSCFQVAALPLGAKLEIEAIAER